MKKPWVALCSTAIGAIYAAGYFATDTQASVLQEPQAQVNMQPANTLFPQQVQVSTPPTSTPSRQQDQVSIPAASASTPTPQRAEENTKPANTPTPQKVKVSTQQPTNTPSPQKVEVSTRPTSTPTPHKVEVSAQPTSTPSNKIYKDGTFSGMGSNRRGSIQVAVTLKNDKITDVEISRFAMHYSERDVVGLPSEVMRNQSARVQNVSGATYSTVAFEDAVQQALNQARNA